MHSAEDVKDHLGKFKYLEKDWIGPGWERWEVATALFPKAILLGSSYFRSQTDQPAPL